MMICMFIFSCQQNLLEQQSKREFTPSRSQDVLTTALTFREGSRSWRLCEPVNFFNIPAGRRNRITKAELLERDRERDAELEKAKKEMAMEMEKTRQEMAELKALLSKANISSPIASDKTSCEANTVKEAKTQVVKELEPELIEVDLEPNPLEKKVK